MSESCAFDQNRPQADPLRQSEGRWIDRCRSVVLQSRTAKIDHQVDVAVPLKLALLFHRQPVLSKSRHILGGRYGVSKSLALDPLATIASLEIGEMARGGGHVDY